MASCSATALRFGYVHSALISIRPSEMIFIDFARLPDFISQLSWRLTRYFTAIKKLIARPKYDA